MAAEKIKSGTRLLTVEVCNAKNLMPKDGQGTASAYAIVDFNAQRRRTKIIPKDLNPNWDEKLEFLIDDSDSDNTEFIEINVYNDKKAVKRSTFLGKVKISATTFLKQAESLSESLLVYYPLEKRTVFSQIKGEIGLKISCSGHISPPNSDAAAAAPETVIQPEAKPDDKTPSADKKVKPKEDDKMDGKTNKDKPAPSPKPKSKKVDKSPPVAKPGEAATPAAAETKPAQQAEKETSRSSNEVKDMMITNTNKQLQLQQQQQQQQQRGVDLIRNEMDIRFTSAGDLSRNGYDLVSRMPYLFVRIVKLKRHPDKLLLSKEPSTSNVYAKMVIGTQSIETTKQQGDKDWDQVYAFDKEGINSASLEVSVWDVTGTAETQSEAHLGNVSFDLQEVPRRVPPGDSPLAPQWYTLEDSASTSVDLMLAVWFGTQADESFQEAWQSDSGGLIPATRAKIYLSPKLWYLRLTIIQAQDLQLASDGKNKIQYPELYVKGQLNAQVFKTGQPNGSSASNPAWHEDLTFVAAEPFDPFIVVTVVDMTSGVSVGHAKIHVASIERRADDRTEARSRWFNLVDDDEKRPYAGRIHVRVCLEGGYHVLDEAAHVTSDVRASAKQLAKPPMGLLEVGIRGATNLVPVKTKDGTRGTMDAYVVAKYGPKWVRTRTILDRFNPHWNEQYTWDVYDPCTVLTIGVFDNGGYKVDENGKPGKDVRIGKLRIRLSTLDTNRVYKNMYSLTVLLPSGAMKMGEIEIAVRFSCPSWVNLMQAYFNPMLPRMHYVRPLNVGQQDILRHTAMRMVAARLARSEPPLGEDVVQFMLDSDTHMWSMRRSKANWFRLVGCLSKVASVLRWLSQVRTWVHPPTTILVHILLVAIVLCPQFVLPTLLMYVFLIVMLRLRYRRHSPLVSMDQRLSYVDFVGQDELDEEFDGFPSTRSADIVRVRYDRLRALAGRVQMLMGDLAAQWERIEALFNWRDPRATTIFVVVCFCASLLLYIVPFNALVLGLAFYYLRHPRFRVDMPSVPVNFFRRLPSLSDQIF